MAERNGSEHTETRPPLTIDLAPDTPQAADGLDGLAMPAAAAAVGGVLGLTLALIFAGLGVWPALGGGGNGEIVQLKADLAAARADTERLAARIGEASSSQPVVPSAAAPAEDGRVVALADRLAVQERALAELKARPVASGASAPGLPDPRLDQFGADITALREALQPAAGLGDRLTRLEAGVAELVTGQVALRPLPEAVATLDGRFARLETSTTDLQRHVATIDTRLGDTIAKVAGAVAARQDAVLALALANLKATVDSGRPFVAELAVAASLASGADLAPLAGLAESGVAPLARLAEVFPPLARRIGEADQAKRASSGSLVDKLVAQAKQSVSIRPIDAAAGPSVPARLVRIAAALDAGKAADALLDWQALPEAARALDPQFDAALTARTRIDALLSTTTRTALDRLAGRAP